jgi:hypothetical protein
MLKWLLADPDVDVRIKGPLGTTALHCAAKYSSSVTAATVGAATAAATAGAGATAAAASQEGADMCALLLKAGVPVDAMERCSGDTCSADGG